MLGPNHRSEGINLLSTLHDEHVALGANFAGYHGRQMVARYSGLDAECAAAAELAIMDLSLWPRGGCRGPGAPDWVSETGNCPGDINQFIACPDGSLLLRPGKDEFWWLERLAPGTQDDQGRPWPSARIFAHADQIASARDVYGLARQHSHALIALTGRLAPRTLAKCCALNLPQCLEPGHFAQTQACGVSVLAIPLDVGSKPGYLLFCDASVTLHVWTSLLQAGDEFNILPAGIDALRALYPG
jgi:glycine cleavage system aminomethyltransferase T